MQKKANSVASPEPGGAGRQAAPPAQPVSAAEWTRRLQAATSLHTGGQYPAARAEYLKLAAAVPPNAHLLLLLGLLERDLENWPMAVRWMELALRIDPAFETHIKLADVRLRQGELARAKQSLKAALAARPGAIEACFQLGLVCKQAGEPDAALAEFARVLEQQPQHVRALEQHSHLLLVLGRMEEAIDGYRRYLPLRPADAVAWYNLGMACQGAGHFAEAAEAYRQAIAANPAFDSAHNNLGISLAQLGDKQAALDAHQTSLQLAPDNANYRFNKGTVLHKLGRFDEAVEDFSRALVLRPDFAAAAFNRGDSLREALRLPEAIASFDLALSLEPGNANFHWTKALAALLHGNYASGWLHYELRWSRDGGEQRRVFAVPQWTGRQDIRGKTLLIHGEQGLGDILQFSRYALDVIALGGRVVFGATPLVHPLLLSMHPAIQCITSHAQHPDFDFHCPVMSLPYAFSTTVETVPAHCPYFFADRPLQEAWRAKLEPALRPRVGLVWFGNPKHLHDHRRSIPLDALKPVLALPLDFHILQQETRARDEATLAKHPALRFHGPALTDFAQTAALIANLDVVLTVDTSVAHLAGALGKPVWLLIHAVPDYRWLLGREDSPWYPSARLFRQARRDSWAEPIGWVRDALIDRFALDLAGACPPV